MPQNKIRNLNAKLNGILHRLPKKHIATILILTWFGVAWSWTLFTDSLNLAGSKSQGLLLAIIISAINISISFIVVRLGIKANEYVFRKYAGLNALFIGLTIFALMEFFIAWGTAIIWIGPHASIDSILPLSSLSLLAINSPLGFASRIVGFYGLAAFIWLTIFLLTNSKRRKLIIIPIACLSFLSLLGWSIYKEPNGHETTTKIVTESLSERVPAINATNTKLVVFPEYGLDKVNNENISERIFSFNEDNGYFLGSEQIIPTEEVGHYNTLLFGTANYGITHKQDKYRLIPGGEDLPYALRVGLRATNQVDTLQYFTYAKGVIKGPEPLKTYSLNDGTIVGAAVCSSIIAPQDYRNFALQGSSLFTNSASLTIFKGSRIFSWQQKSLAKFMAIANSRYFLQSANSARAYALDNNGNTIAEATGHQVLDVTVQNNYTKTVYTYAGEWLAWIGFIVAAALYLNTRLDLEKAFKLKSRKDKRNNRKVKK